MGEELARYIISRWTFPLKLKLEHDGGGGANRNLPGYHGTVIKRVGFVVKVDSDGLDGELRFKQNHRSSPKTARIARFVLSL